jgi:hypothetical protein
MTNNDMNPTPTPEQVPATWIATGGERADDKRPGALCTRGECIHDVILRMARTGKGTLRTTPDGRLAVKHGRSGSPARRARNAALIASQPTCAWCGGDYGDRPEHDRILAGCEYAAANLVAACKPCNRERSNTPADDYAAACADPDHARAVLARVRADHAAWHAARA